MGNATTGLVNNGSLVQYAKNNSSDQWDILLLPSLENNNLRLLFNGDLPTTKGVLTDISVSFFLGKLPLFSATVSANVQGASSQTAYKKNYKFKLINPTTGNKLKVKFGNWLPMSSLTLKGYASDRTMIRDSLSAMIYDSMIRSKTGLTAPSSEYDYLSGINCGVTIGEASFTTAGFPIELYNKDGFFGLYVLRASNDVEDYLLDESNAQHIFMQPKLSNNFWIDGVFDTSKWDIDLPTIQGDTFTSSVTRLFQWFNSCVNGTVDMRSTYDNFINLPRFIDYVLLTELCMNCDTIQNNLILTSQDTTPTSGIWSIHPYDMDQSFGLIGIYPFTNADPKTFGWVTHPNDQSYHRRPFDLTNPFFTLFWKTFRPEIWHRWAELREVDTISAKSINKLIQRQVALINPKSMEMDLALFPLSEQTGMGTGNAVSSDGKKFSIAYIVEFVKDRIEWLDTQFNY